MKKIDLHTHSEASKDGGITAEQYATILRNEILDVVAITDHNRIDFAQGMQKALGADKIIVGEEIMTLQGEIIGLYLEKKIDPGMSAQETIDAIKLQNGIVYIPHPFEKVRKGIQEDVLLALIDEVDILEGYNGRAFVQNFTTKTLSLAKKHDIPAAASSDAHGLAGIGISYTTIKKQPERYNLSALIAHGRLATGKPPLYTLLFPKINRLKKLLQGKK